MIAAVFALLAVGLCLLDGDIDDDEASRACPTVVGVVAMAGLLPLAALGLAAPSVALSISASPVRSLDPPPKPVLVV
jgi:hypothetical protein